RSWYRAGDAASDAQRLGAACPLQPEQVKGSDDEDGAHERRDDARDQGHGKALYGARAVLVEHRGREDRRDVRVDDGGHRVLEAFVDRGANRLAAIELLTNALEDQHIRVDGDTDRQ